MGVYEALFWVVGAECGWVGVGGDEWGGWG